MINISKEKFIERWDALPDEIKEAALDYETEKTIENACSAFKLDEKTVEAVENLVFLALYGFIDYKDLARLISSEGVAPDISEKISLDIDARIFSPLRSILSSDLERLSPKPASEPIKPTFPQTPENDAASAKTELTKEVSLAPPSPSKIIRPSFSSEPAVIHKAEPDISQTETGQPAFGIGYKIKDGEDESGAAHITAAQPVINAPEQPPRVVNYSEFRTPLEKSEAAQPPIQSTPENQQINPAIPSQNIVNLKKNEQVPAEPSKENTENTINLKDLPL